MSDADTDADRDAEPQQQYTRHFPVSWQELHRDAKALRGA